MKILIVGSEGFVGSHLVSYFTARDYNVYGCGRVEKNAAHYTYFHVQSPFFKWDSIFSQHEFDYCINAAGNGNVNYSFTNPAEDFEANTLVTIGILDAIRKHNPGCRYLHVSSAAVYGNPVSLPVKETDVCSPISPYGLHKLMAEQLCREYCLLYHLSVAVVRPFSIYGPGLKKQILWDTFQKYTKNNQQVELLGTGNESRDFIYIDDVVRAFEIILQKAPMQAEVYNIASGKETSTREVVEKLFQYLDKKPVIIFNNQTRQGDPLNWQADVTEIKKLDFTPLVDLPAGIQKMASWLLKQT